MGETRKQNKNKTEDSVVKTKTLISSNCTANLHLCFRIYADCWFSDAAAQICFESFQENVGSFITPDKLDAELDKLLNTRVDYDFALNLDGTTTKDSEKLEENDNENAT